MMEFPWRQWRPARRQNPGFGRPPKSLRRQQWELLLIYLGSVATILMVFAVVVREVSLNSELRDIRGELNLISEDLAGLAIPAPGDEKDLENNRKDFAAAHQQVEWFSSNHNRPFARLGEIRNLGPLPKHLSGKTIAWQASDEWLAVVRPVEVNMGRGTVWLRVSQGLEPSEQRQHQLDLALLVAISSALVLSAVSAWLLTRRAIYPLERSLQRLRQFSLDASHELRGPLAALAANAEMGLLDLEENPHQPSINSQRRRFEAIASATEQMEQLVEDLLLLARQDEQRLDAPISVALSSLLEQQIDLQRDAYALKDIGLTAIISPDLAVMGQALLLQRLVRNLLDNSLAYTKPGGRVSMVAILRGNSVVITIEDSGIGLSPHELAQVFDRFWRAKFDRTRGGSGLGLAIASRICASHGGTIHATSRPGEGSCFVVELPSLATGR